MKRNLRYILTIILTFLAVAAPASAVAAEERRENVVFWYQDSTGQEKWGEAFRVVSLQADPALIHSRGSEAWKYGQISFFPEQRQSPWNGTTTEQRLAWRLCRVGAEQGVADLTRHPPAVWYWADYNERAFSDAMVAWAQSIKAAGWDGLFFDTVGFTLKGPERNTVSTCTSDPIQPGATQTQAYVNLARRIHAEAGMPIAANNPPSALIDAHLGTWLAWYMRENQGTPGSPIEKTLLHATYDARHPFGSVVHMGQSTLPPGHPGKSAHEAYTWGRAKLAGHLVVVNTGDDQCPQGAPNNYCLRMGVPTDLVNLRLGPAIGTVGMQDCDQGTARCVFYRRFRKGLVVVNVEGRTRRVDLSNARCHRMYRMRAGWLNDGRCSSRFAKNIGPERAWIISYR